jgi:hypothetical protein
VTRSPQSATARKDELQSVCNLTDAYRLLAGDGKDEILHAAINEITDASIYSVI